MKATVLMDNTAPEGLLCEWGLSIWIEHEGRRILLDAGSTGDFAENAARLGIDLAQADFAVLSHAHYDHADGLGEFFARNERARLYVRAGAGEDCVKSADGGYEYIGIKKGLLAQYAERIVYADGVTELCPGAWLLPHTTQGLALTGEHAGMYRETRGGVAADDFSHEQSLVVRDARGLVIFSSCSHAGADVIIRETLAAFPGERVYALVGGLHLYRSTDGEVLALARRVRETGIDLVVTGHCTGDAASALLARELGDRFRLFSSGCVI